MNVEAFIGDLGDPAFDYENGSYSGNIPKRISMFFPESHKVFSEIIDKIEKGEIKGRQTDWGSWTATLYPNEILSIMIEVYGEKACSMDSNIRKTPRFVRQLGSTKQYGLVACEIS